MTLVLYLSISQYKNSTTIRMSATVNPSVNDALHGNSVKKQLSLLDCCLEKKIKAATVSQAKQG